MKTDIKWGCDYCGEAVPVTKAKKHLSMSKQWVNVWLCDECIKTVKEESRKMKQGRTREEYLKDIKTTT